MYNCRKGATVDVEVIDRRDFTGEVNSPIIVLNKDLGAPVGKGTNDHNGLYLLPTGDGSFEIFRAYVTVWNFKGKPQVGTLIDTVDSSKLLEAIYKYV